VKDVELVAVPAEVVTEIGPVVAPIGTLAFTMVAELITTALAVTPLNFTTAPEMKLVPLIVTTVPTAPEVGEKLVIVGVVPLERESGSGVAVAPLLGAVPRPNAA
jgi:hypothetical protein